MKRKFFFALAAVLMLGFVACNKDDDKKDNGNSNDPTLVGTWKISKVLVDNQEMDLPFLANAQIVMNADGWGTIKMNGQDFPFTWSSIGNTLNINNGGSEEIVCNIEHLTADECTLTSSNMAFPGIGVVPGTVTITLTRGGSGDNNNYSTLIVGTWQTTQTIVDGTDVTAQVGNVELSFNANGRGLLNHNGETHNNGFSWSISGNTITINPDRDTPATFTILNLDGNTCTFTGTRMPGSDEEYSEIRITMVKKGNTPDPDPVDGELAGTAWGYITDTTVTETVEGSTMEISTQGSVNLTFTSASQGTLAVNITVAVSVDGVPIPEYGRTINDSAPFTYTYDPSTLTGTLTARGVDGDDITVSFTYDPTRNVIIAVNNNYDAESDMLPQTIVFSRIR